MPGIIKGTVDGLGPVLNRMRQFKRGVRNRAMKRGLTKIGRRIAKTAKGNLSTKTANNVLRKSIGVKVYVKGESVIAIIGPRWGFKTQIGVRKRAGKKSSVGDPIYEDPALIGRLVEFGHGGPHAAQANPFMRPAWDGERDNVIPILGAECQVEIDTQASRGR